MELTFTRTITVEEKPVFLNKGNPELVRCIGCGKELEKGRPCYYTFVEETSADEGICVKCMKENIERNIK